MKKIGIALVIASLVAAALFFLPSKKEEVFTTVEHLPIVEVAFPREGGKPWVFQASVCGRERRFDVYPGIVRALIDDYRVAMNLTDCDEQDFRNGSSYEYIGKTPEGVYLLLVYDLDKSHILFVEILKGQGVTLHGKLGAYPGEKEDRRLIFYDDQVLIKKVGKITIPSFWKKGDESDWQYRTIKLDGKTLSIGSVEFTLDLSPPSPPRLVKKEVPYHWDARPYINPCLLLEFRSSWRDGGTVDIAYDLIKAQNDPNHSYSGVGLNSDPLGDFSYIYQGMSNNGVHIVKVINEETRPTDARHLMLVFEEDYELNVDWDAKMITRDKKLILIKTVGELDLHLSKPFVLKENTISYTEMDWESRPFAITGPVEHEEFIYEIEL